MDILSQHNISVLHHTAEALDQEIQAAQDLARQSGK
jgi:hypothetical protein